MSLLAERFLVHDRIEQERLDRCARRGLAALLGVVRFAAAEWLHRHEGATGATVIPVAASPLRRRRSYGESESVPQARRAHD